MSEIAACEKIQSRLENSLNRLAADIGQVQIGTREQFPYGWRKAAKGRTVWRLLEETISQNLELKHSQYGIAEFKPSASEVSVFDCSLVVEGTDEEIYLNIKSSVKGSKSSKDDISKANGLLGFLSEDIGRKLFIATFVIDFTDDMRIHLETCYVMPVHWIPDVYVNPSNNGNLQSSKYKNLEMAEKRTNREFFEVLVAEMEVARQKREAKRSATGTGR